MPHGNSCRLIVPASPQRRIAKSDVQPDSITSEAEPKSKAISGHSGHLDCFVQLSENRNEETEEQELQKTRKMPGMPGNESTTAPSHDHRAIHSDYTADNNPSPSQNGVATALTGRPNDDSGGEELSDREARRISGNLRQQYRNGYVVQPDPKNLSIWMVGKNVDGTIRWLEQHGTREWAVEEVQRRLEPKSTPPPPAIPDENDDEDHSADVLNTLICDIDDGKFDLSNPDDLEIVKDQIATDIPEVADMAESLLLDLEDGHLTLDDVRQRADEMLGVLMQMEEKMTQDEAFIYG
jgi:hypothetical protein